MNFNNIHITHEEERREKKTKGKWISLALAHDPGDMVKPSMYNCLTLIKGSLNPKGQELCRPGGRILQVVFCRLRDQIYHSCPPQHRSDMNSHVWVQFRSTSNTTETNSDTKSIRTCGHKTMKQYVTIHNPNLTSKIKSIHWDFSVECRRTVKI